MKKEKLKTKLGFQLFAYPVDNAAAIIKTTIQNSLVDGCLFLLIVNMHNAECGTSTSKMNNRFF